MAEFYGNPIKVIYKDEFKFFIELDIDFNEIDYDLIIEAGKEIIFNNEFNESTFINIDSSVHNEINLKYVNKNNKKTILEKKYKLREKIEKYEETNEDSREKKGLIEKIYEEVRDKMDNPQGTDLEIDEHTKMLKSVTANTTARRYIERKIENIVYAHAGKFNEKEIEKLVYEIY
jgi:hypothetical protein